MAMDREVRDQWIADLRSGRYKQGVNALRVKNDSGVQYCCLGVLGNRLPGARWSSDLPYTNNCSLVASGLPSAGFSIETQFEPNQLRVLGLTVKQQDKLVQMNDGFDPHALNHTEATARSFDEIADWIEKNVSVKAGT